MADDLTSLLLPAVACALVALASLCESPAARVALSSLAHSIGVM